ncbi:MAG: ATP-binding cassette domain-containing protein [Acidimicrobiia bacterium]
MIGQAVGGVRARVLPVPERRLGWLAAVVMGVLAVVWVLRAPGYWVFTANAGLILGVTTLGLLVVVGWANEVSLVQAGLTGTAVYVSAWADRPGNGLDWPFLAAAGFGIGVVVVLSVVVSLATAKLSGMYIMVLTLALQATLERTVFTYGSMTSGGVGSAATRPSLLGVSLEGDRAYFFFSVCVLGGVVVFLARLRHSRYGRALLLVGTDRQAASAVGVSPWRSKILAFVVAGFCAGVAGALTAPLFTTPPSYVGYTAFNSLFYLAIPVLAGFRSLVGLAALAMVFLLVPQALESYGVSPFALGGLGLVLGTVIGPGGLSGLVADRVRAARWARAAGAAPVEVLGLRDLATGAREPGRGPEHQHALDVLEEYLPPRAQEGDALACRDVSVSFGGVQALRQVSITVPAGALVGLIGPNGAGKTTLFDVVNGLRKAETGNVMLFGTDITPTRAWDRAALGVSRTFQASRLNLDLSVAENLLAGAYTMIPGNLASSVLGLPRSRAGMQRAEQAAWAVAQLLAVDHYWDQPVRVLSFGNRRRVEIGRSVMSGPRLLLLDEPSAGLDPKAAGLLFALVKQLHQDLGLTVLLVEHYVRAVLENCDLVYVLGRGEVVAAGSPDEVANHPEVRSQYLGPDFDARRLAWASKRSPA